MKIKFLNTINYISVFFYLWIITLIFRIFFIYGFDYGSILIRPEDMNLGIHYSCFLYIYVILLLIIPVSLLFSTIYLIRKKSLTKESLVFCIVNLFFLVEVFFVKPDIFLWLAN